MARFGITYQDVANAAERIKEQGKQPTIELIRNHLGTGSTTTIANHLRTWRAGQDGSIGIAIKENLPQEFISVMKGLWQRLLADADAKIELVKVEGEQSIGILRQEMEKYKSNNQRWQKLHDQWVKEKEEFTRENLGLEQGIISLQNENVTCIAKLDAQQQQLSEKQLRIDELNRLHKLAQENLEHYRESSRVQRLVDQDKYAQQLQQIESAFKNAEQQLQKSNHEMFAMQKQLDKEMNNNELLQNTNKITSSKLQLLEQNASKLENELSDSIHKMMHWQHQHEILQNKYDQSCLKVADNDKQIAVLCEQLSTVRVEATKLKDQNILLAHEKWEIAEEKAQMEGQMKQMQKMIPIKEVV